MYLSIFWEYSNVNRLKEKNQHCILCLLSRDMFWYYPEANGVLLLALGNEGILSFARNLYGRHQEIMDLELEAPYTVQFFSVNFL